jgi:hypothetical protein
MMRFAVDVGTKTRPGALTEYTKSVNASAGRKLCQLADGYEFAYQSGSGGFEQQHLPILSNIGAAPA